MERQKPHCGNYVSPHLVAVRFPIISFENFTIYKRGVSFFGFISSSPEQQDRKAQDTFDIIENYPSVKLNNSIPHIKTPAMEPAVTIGIVASAGLLGMVVLGFVVVGCCLRRRY
jgi:hypothetical protein